MNERKTDGMNEWMEIIHKDEGKREMPDMQWLLFSLFEGYSF
jgi:hypothetical protein